MIPSHFDYTLRVKAFGQLIRTEREAQCLSLDELALRCGVTRLTILMVEQGRANAKITTIFTICDALNLCVSINKQEDDHEGCL